MNNLRLVSFVLPFAIACSENFDTGPAGSPDGGAGGESPDGGGTGGSPDGGTDPEAHVPSTPPPGVALLDYHLAIDVTPDGTLAVFERLTSTEAVAYFYDTVTGLSTEAAVIGDPSRHLATAISATRRLTAFRQMPVQAGVWTQGGGWLDLGSPHAAGCGPDELSGAWDVSADGRVVVGMAWDGCSPDAFLWTDANGAGTFTMLERLGSPAPGSASLPSNRATVVSDNGAVAAGFAQNGPIDRSPAVWNADGTGFLLDPDEVDAPGEVLSISADGATLAGIQAFEGFVWTSETGMVPLPRLDTSLPSDPVYPNAIADNGRLVLGGIGDAFFSIPTAFVWTAEEGTRALTDLAAAAGVDLPDGTVLCNVLAASSDGTVLIGTAFDAGFNPKTFVLRLPAGAL
jgi:probable HAF family extracellular repeat protein